MTLNNFSGAPGCPSVPNELEIRLELRRAAAVSRNRYSAGIGDIQQEEKDKKRYHGRESRNIRENKGGVVLHDRAGPTDQWMDFVSPVMTGVQVVPGVEMKTTGLGLLKIKKTGVAHKPRSDVNHDQKTGYHYSYACSYTRL